MDLRPCIRQFDCHYRTAHAPDCCTCSKPLLKFTPRTPMFLVKWYNRAPLQHVPVIKIIGDVSSKTKERSDRILEIHT